MAYSDTYKNRAGTSIDIFEAINEQIAGRPVTYSDGSPVTLNLSDTPQLQHSASSLVVPRNVSSVSLDGSNGYVTLSSALPFEQNNKFSLALWTRLDSFSNVTAPRFFEKNPHNLQLMGNSGDGKFRQVGLQVLNGTSTLADFWGSTKLNTNAWYHIAVTFDGSLGSAQGKIYINGHPETMTNPNAWSGTLKTTSGNTAYIGRQGPDLTQNLKGRISRIAFWNSVLTPNQIAQAYLGLSLAVSPFFYLPLAGNATDASGNGWNGTTVSAASISLFD